MHLPSPALRRTVRRALLAWFRRRQRDLPWRRDRDPYRIWVSEIMLQQTQVSTVIPYFARFLTAFPTLADLADAKEQDVLRLWEGLGYYRRARHLHQAARRIRDEFAGEFPRDLGAVRGLPGIGRYTAGAILSQAFDQRLPILETNSQRVLCRLLGVRDDPRRTETRNALWQVAEALLPLRAVGEFNQALMELGALVCTPAHPKCTECPLAPHCTARREGLQESIPQRAAAPRTVEVRETAVVVHRGRRVLLVQRPDKGRWSGMWEFPHAALEEGESHELAAARCVHALTGIRVRLGAELLTIRHAVTHHRITLVCFESEYLKGEFRSDFYQDAKWVLPGRLSGFPVSRPQRRLAELLIAPDR